MGDFGEGTFGEGEFGETISPDGFGQGPFGEGPFGPGPETPDDGGFFGEGTFGEGPFGGPGGPALGGFGSGAFGAGPFGQSPAPPAPPEPEDPGDLPVIGFGPDIIFPDAMPDIRYWLRNHPFLSELTAGRVFFSIPAKPSQAPFIRIYASGGGPQQGDSPVMDLRIGIDIWGMKNSDYNAVRQTELALQSAAFRLATGMVIGPNNTRLHNVDLTTSFDSPDPTLGWPRRVLDAVFTVSL